ncbi:MAG: DUF2075 domain-containing protein [Phycisphaerales bacterium]
MINRAFYSDLIETFLDRDTDHILGQLTRGSTFAVETTQRDAWTAQIQVLRRTLEPYRGCGKVYFEYAVPRVGKRVDVVAVLRHVVFVLEFKVGQAEFVASANEQVWDYALDLKNFHETSHNKPVAPILIATQSVNAATAIATTGHGDGVLLPIHTTTEDLGSVIERVLEFCEGDPIDGADWDAGRYRPTPTIIEAAMALYGRHAVADISRSDASAINLTQTSEAISAIIRSSREHSRKAICFVTGVPGAGKTLVGLNIATQHSELTSELYSVFLSGNGPLVAVLREALARDHVRRAKHTGERVRKGVALSRVKGFIQNVHHFRDECLVDRGPPIEHVALFDEAQRAWDLDKTANFMARKKGKPNFSQSEPEFLISCLDRHPDWAVVVCLVGGGQEINTGEAGIGEWVESLLRAFPEWHIHISPRLQDSEYGTGASLESLRGRPNVHPNADLHLAVSMRSFRAESVSALVKSILDLDEREARRLLSDVAARYPMVLTRDLQRAKKWLREQARGSERYGIVVSSRAQRLKPHAIDVRSPMDPIHWFLDGKEDVRSSYFLEDVATEFHVQGLELDWACVVWDGDFRYTPDGWTHWSFVGDRWNRVLKAARQTYLKNAYRVLLTRARQGMVIVVPEGSPHSPTSPPHDDPTRRPEYYDATFEYLRRIGLREI